jgi:peptidoglycan/LPS O-acetylase OafA/YrhL
MDATDKEKVEAYNKEDVFLYNEDNGLLSGACKKTSWIHLFWLQICRLWNNCFQIPRHLPKALIKIGRDLLPSPLTDSSAHFVSRKNNSVAAIDGLRGIACLIVFHGHLSHNFSTLFIDGVWAGRVYLVQWPILRIIWSSTSMVRVFWVVGGYTLGLKPLKLLRAGDYTGFQRSWSSSLVRRGFRLYLPPMVGVWLIGLLNWLGLFAAARAATHDRPKLHFAEKILDPQSNLITQMVDAFRCSLRLFKIWEWDNQVHPGLYNNAYWNVPVQYRTAIFLFVVLLAGSRLKPAYRTILLGSFCILGIFVWERAEIATFFGGMFLADLDVRRSSIATSLPSHDDILSQQSSPRLLRSLSGRLGNTLHGLGTIFQMQGVYLIMFILGMLFCSVSAFNIEKQPFIGSIVSAVPFMATGYGQPLRCIGAMLLTYGAIHCKYIQPLFTSRVASYLGKLSYSLYLVHGVILRAVLYPLLPHIYHAVGCDGPADWDGKCSSADFFMSYMMAVAVCVPLVLWASDVFWRKVEAPLARLSMSLERFLAPSDA